MTSGMKPDATKPHLAKRFLSLYISGWECVIKIGSPSEVDNIYQDKDAAGYNKN